MSSCFDNDDPNTLWLDTIGRTCKFYNSTEGDCNDFTYIDLPNITNQTHPCCTCRGLQSSSTYNINTKECVDGVGVWAIVVVAFCLLLTCILSMSFYFVCHLLRFVYNPIYIYIYKTIDNL